MTSKHWKWQARWTVNLAARVAVHDSGIRVNLAGPRPTVEDYPAALAQLAATHGGHNAPRMLARMLREAAEVAEAAAARLPRY